MTLTWLRIRWYARAALGIRDMRQGTLRMRIERIKAQRSA